MTAPEQDSRARWEARYATAGEDKAPSRWVIERCLALPAATLIVDVAAGLGRHARPLAAAGRRVVAVDFVERAVAHAARGGAVLGVVADAALLPFADGSLDAILSVNYLDRSLFAVFARLLRPGGRLVVETYTRRHAALVAEGRARAPRNPAYMLEPGELPRLVAPLAGVDGREELVRDDAGERWVAGVVAEKR